MDIKARIRDLWEAFNGGRPLYGEPLMEFAARVAALASLSDGEVVFFSREPKIAPIAEHLAQGRRAVVLRNGSIVLASGAESIALIELDQIPMAMHDAPAFQTENALAAVAAAWALGISHELIRAVIETFDPSRDEALDKPPQATTSA